MSNPVVWFEIPAKNLGRAEKFYSKVFGYEFDQNEMGPLKLAMIKGDMEGSGATGALVEAEGYVPSQTGTIVYLGCEGIDPTLAKIEAAGGKTLMAKMAIGEHGFVAHFSDPDGNHVAIHAMK